MWTTFRTDSTPPFARSADHRRARQKEPSARVRDHHWIEPALLYQVVSLDVTEHVYRTYTTRSKSKTRVGCKHGNRRLLCRSRAPLKVDISAHRHGGMVPRAPADSHGSVLSGDVLQNIRPLELRRPGQLESLQRPISRSTAMKDAFRGYQWIRTAR